MSYYQKSSSNIEVAFPELIITIPKPLTTLLKLRFVREIEYIVHTPFGDWFCMNLGQTESRVGLVEAAANCAAGVVFLEIKDQPSDLGYGNRNR